MRYFFRLILLIINVLAAGVLVLSGYGGHFNPVLSAIPGIMLMLFPAFLAFSVILLIIDFFAWRLMAVVQALCILTCAPAFWNFCPLSIADNTRYEDKSTLSVLSYNVYAMLRYPAKLGPGAVSPETVRTILDADADVVLMQEGRMSDPSQWSGLEGLNDSIVARYPYRLLSDRALALWSKYEVTDIPISQPEDPTGVFQCVKINVGGEPVILYNIHLQSIGLSDADKELYTSLTDKPTKHKLAEARYDIIAKLSHAMKVRGRQAHLLRENIDSVGGSNVIVAGDFNDIEGCYAQRVIAGNTLKSCYTEVGFGPTITYHANRFYFNIDHIMYGGRLHPLGFERLKRPSSDHYAVKATFSL